MSMPDIYSEQEDEPKNMIKMWKVMVILLSIFIPIFFLSVSGVVYWVEWLEKEPPTVVEIPVKVEPTYPQVYFVAKDYQFQRNNSGEVHLPGTEVVIPPEIIPNFLGGISNVYDKDGNSNGELCYRDNSSRLWCVNRYHNTAQITIKKD